MSEAQSRVSPIVAIAAVAVIVFSVVGVGVMTGVIPSSRSTESAVPVPAPAPAASVAPDSKPSQAALQRANPTAAATKQPPTRVAVAEPVSSAASSNAPGSAPVPVQAPAPEPTQTADAVPAPVPVAAVPRVCAECGVVDKINVVEQKGQGSGIGVAGGAVVGGLLGNQVGSGRGNTVATVLGAVGGALAGNEVEKRVKSTKQYHVSVRMDDGNFKTLTFDSAPPFAVGEKVKVIGGKLVKS